MKKVILTILPLVFVFVACDDDSANDPQRTGTFEQRVTGNWNLVDVDYQGEMPNPFNPNQDVSFSGEGEDTFGVFHFYSDGTAEYEMGFTARIDIGTSEPARLPFYRPGSGDWWITENKDSIFVAESVDTIGYKVIEDTDSKQRWQTILPILDSVSNTFVDVELQVILRR